MKHVPHSAEALDAIPIEDLESIIRDQVPPGVFRLALQWAERQCDYQVGQFIDALAAHDPRTASLCAHVADELNSVEGLCSPAKERLAGTAAS